MEVISGRKLLNLAVLPRLRSRNRPTRDRRMLLELLLQTLDKCIGGGKLSRSGSVHCASFTPDAERSRVLFPQLLVSCKFAGNAHAYKMQTGL